MAILSGVILHIKHTEVTTPGGTDFEASMSPTTVRCSGSKRNTLHCLQEIRCVQFSRNAWLLALSFIPHF